MVEGHGTHRVAAAHRAALKGKAFVASSPNGRFVDGAAAVNGKTLTDVQAHGKNLFYVFGSGADTVVVHVHFGMSGRFSTHALPGPEPTPTTRLRLVHAPSATVAHLSAMTCDFGDTAFMASVRSRLGPDPLREDADPEALWSKMRVSRKPVGLILMDQAMVSSLGNIYRAEVLFKAGVHPETPGTAVSRQAFEAIWRHSVLLLQAGFTTGSIITVDPQEGLPAPWTRRYIYNQSHCGRCKGPIMTWDMATRTVYCCETCQPRLGVMTTARAEAHAKAAPPRLFQSHCAPDGGEALPPAKMSLAQLKEALAARKVANTGAKATLVASLEAAIAADAAAGVKPEQLPKAAAPKKEATEEVETYAVPAAVYAVLASCPPGVMPRPGTAHLGGFASAAEAAADKAAAGESAAVEHVALEDDASLAARLNSKSGTTKRARSKAMPAPALVADAPPGAVPFPARKRRS